MKRNETHCLSKDSKPESDDRCLSNVANCQLVIELFTLTRIKKEEIYVRNNLFNTSNNKEHTKLVLDLISEFT